MTTPIPKIPVIAHNTALELVEAMRAGDAALRLPFVAYRER